MAGFDFTHIFDIAVGFFIFIMGSIVGSFLNVCTYRLPRQQSVIKPRSHCVHCNKLIVWYDNIPLLSYLILGAKCRFCKKNISFQYFIVESLTAILFLLFYKYFGLGPKMFIYIIFVCGLIIATFVDFNFRIIPDEISIGGIVLGLIVSLLYPILHNTTNHLLGLYRAFLGVVIGGGIIWLTGIIGDFIFKKETMGGGDVKLLAMIGAFLGWPGAILSFFIAPLFGSLVGIIVKLKTKSSLIAYGPYLALSSIVVLLWGDKIIRWVLFR